jgi:hypothetical protein
MASEIIARLPVSTPPTSSIRVKMLLRKKAIFKLPEETSLL